MAVRIRRTQNKANNAMSNPVKNRPVACERPSDSNGIAKQSAAVCSVQHISNESDFDKLEQDWNALHAQHTSASVFTTWHWSRSWWAHYGDSGKLFILSVRVNGVVRGIAPLYICESQVLRLFKLRTLRFIGSGGDTAPDDLDIVYHPSYEAQVMTAICDEIIRITHLARIQLTDIPDGSMLIEVLQAATYEGKWSHANCNFQTRLVDELPQTVEQYEQQLSRNARKQMRRRLKRISQEDNVRFEMCQSEEAIEESFAHLQRLHTLRRNSKGQTGKFHSQRYSSFHLILMKQLLARGELSLLRLSIGDKVIGIEYAFLCKGVMYFFQTGFDPDYQHLSPGHLLMMHSIDNAISNGAHQIDLLKGEYDYKRTYAKKQVQSVDMEIWKNPVLGMLARAIQQLRDKN